MSAEILYVIHADAAVPLHVKGVCVLMSNQSILVMVAVGSVVVSVQLIDRYENLNP